MEIKSRVVLALSLVLLFGGTAVAQPKPNLQPSPTATLTDTEKLEIGNQVQEEVDRAFGHTTTILNILLVVLTLLPIFAAVGVWLLYRSVISELASEAKKQLEAEVKIQLEKEVTAELKKQTEAFKQEIERLKSEELKKQTEAFKQEIEELKSKFVSQLSKLELDAQKEKEIIMQKITLITPSSIEQSIAPEVQKKIQQLTTELDKLKSANTQLSFTADEYINQGNAFFYSRRYDDALASYQKAIELQPDKPEAWFYKGITLGEGKQMYEEAIAAYKQAIKLKPDYSEALVDQGYALRKLQRYEESIASLDKAIEVKPEHSRAWYNRACSHAQKGNINLAIQDLKQAIKLNSSRYTGMAKTDPNFDQLREDERFQKLIAG